MRERVMTEEFKRELINSTKKNSSYLEHSAKGTSWNKKDHKYVQKVVLNGKTKYIYGTDKDARTISNATESTIDAITYADSVNRLTNNPTYNNPFFKDQLAQDRRKMMNARKDTALAVSSLSKKTIFSLISSSLKKTVSSVQHNTIDRAKTYLNRKKLESKKNYHDPNKLYLNNGKTIVSFSDVKLGKMK